MCDVRPCAFVSLCVFVCVFCKRALHTYTLKLTAVCRCICELERKKCAVVWHRRCWLVRSFVSELHTKLKYGKFDFCWTGGKAVESWAGRQAGRQASKADREPTENKTRTRKCAKRKRNNFVRRRSASSRVLTYSDAKYHIKSASCEKTTTKNKHYSSSDINRPCIGTPTKLANTTIICSKNKN